LAYNLSPVRQLKKVKTNNTSRDCPNCHPILHPSVKPNITIKPITHDNNNPIDTQVALLSYSKFINVDRNHAG